MGKINGSKILIIGITILAAKPYAENTTNQVALSSSSEKYIIKKDDTLWDLADTFLGDSYMWQDLWENNSYIHNPNLIYAGDPISVPGLEPTLESNVATNELESNSSELSSDESFSFDSNNDDSIPDINPTIEESSDEIEISELIGSLQRKNFLSGKFFAQIPFLWTEKDSSGKVAFGNGTVKKKGDDQMYFIMDKITAELQKGAHYKVDDTVDIIKPIKRVRINGKSSILLKRTGRAKVTRLFSNIVEAKLFEMWDVISGKERIAPKQKFFEMGILDSLITPDVKIKGKISLRVEESACPIPYQVLILDKGAADGVKHGDIFAVYTQVNNKTNGTLSLIGYVASLTSNSSSLVILTISDENVHPNSNAELIWRSVSNEG